MCNVVLLCGAGAPPARPRASAAEKPCPFPAVTTTTMTITRRTIGEVIAWIWTILAAGGGVMLLFERGPWPLTNGWFALASGLAACPLTAWASTRILGKTPSGRVRFAAAALIWLAGQTARRIGM